MNLFHEIPKGNVSDKSNSLAIVMEIQLIGLLKMMNCERDKVVLECLAMLARKHIIHFQFKIIMKKIINKEVILLNVLTQDE